MVLEAERLTNQLDNQTQPGDRRESGCDSSNDMSLSTGLESLDLASIEKPPPFEFTVGETAPPLS